MFPFDVQSKIQITANKKLYPVYYIILYLQDSPTNKLLFAKDIPKYRKWVERYYQQVRDMVPVSDQDMNVAMTEISMVSWLTK